MPFPFLTRYLRAVTPLEMNSSHHLALLLVYIFVIFVQGQEKYAFEADPNHYSEQWSHYDKCHFFDKRNDDFWDRHHCEYIDCSSHNGSCADSVYGKWPVMVTRYSDGCPYVHPRVPYAPSSSCWSDKTMTLCCTFGADPSRIVKVVPFHKRNESITHYWPYQPEYDYRVTWGPDPPLVPIYPAPNRYGYRV